MRPRLITAENRAARCAGARQPAPASMRPRLITAENTPNEARAALGYEASMRPRLITAENSRCRRRRP